MLIALLAVLCGTSVEQSAAPRPPFTPRAVLYAYPTSTAAMAGYQAVDFRYALYGALGTSVRLTQNLGLDAELAAGRLDAKPEQQAGWLFSLGLGPSLQLTGDEAFRGLFLATRFRFEAFQPAERLVFRGPTPRGPVDLGPGTSRAFLGELDVGYHLRLGRFYVAPILGIGVGYAYDYVDGTGVGLLSPFTVKSTRFQRPQGIVWTLNLNLARLGVAL